MAFQQDVERFNDRLSSLFTRTITEQSLQPLIAQSVAYVAFGSANRFGHSPNVELGNGCRIRVSQTLLPNPDTLSGVTTTRYVYAYALGTDPKRDWLLRYDYTPDQANAYPVPHVHFNGTSEAYSRFRGRKNKPLHKLHCPTDRITIEDFIEHLIIEFDAPTHHGKSAALALLAESRRKFHKEDRTRMPPYDSPEPAGRD